MTPIPILLYHSVGHTRTPAYRRWCVEPRLFEAQLDALIGDGHDCVTVSGLVDALDAGELPDKPLLITFDDGLADFADHAIPTLEQRSLASTMYVVSGRVGGVSDWLDMPGEDDRPMMTWSDLEAVASAGHEIGAHSQTHRELDVLSHDGARAEIEGSRRELEDGLGRAVRSFAYPHGYHSPRVVETTVAAGFDSACAVSNRWSWVGERRHSLSRLIVEGTTTPDELLARLSRAAGQAWATTSTPTRRVARGAPGSSRSTGGDAIMRRALTSLAALSLAALSLAACTTSVAQGDTPGSADPTAGEDAELTGGSTPPETAAAPEPTVSTAEPTVSTATPTDPPTTDAPTTTIAAPSLAVPEGDEWELVFFDDFDGDSLDEVWNTCHWWQVDGGCTIASNDEQQWYRPEAVTLGEGDLRLRATADPQQTTDGDVLPFRSGMVTTGPRSDDDETSSFSFTYGEVSARAMVPAGAGAWPALWLLSADKTSLPEIDIFEWYGSRPDTVTSHVHNRVDGERAKERVETTVSDFAGEWHEFTMTWLPDRVVFSLDGAEVGRVTDPDLVPSTPMYLVANLAMGGEAGSVDPDALPLTLRIDEIVVSQWNGR